MTPELRALGIVPAGDQYTRGKKNGLDSDLVEIPQELIEGESHPALGHIMILSGIGLTLYCI
jgi:hypothetical protein